MELFINKIKEMINRYMVSIVLIFIFSAILAFITRPDIFFRHGSGIVEKVYASKIKSTSSKHMNSFFKVYRIHIQKGSKDLYTLNDTDIDVYGAENLIGKQIDYIYERNTLNGESIQKIYIDNERILPIKESNDTFFYVFFLIALLTGASSAWLFVEYWKKIAQNSRW